MADFELRRMQNNSGDWLGWAATGALAATYVTHEDRAESRSAVSVISRAQRKRSMIPF